MKKTFTLLAALFCAVAMNAQLLEGDFSKLVTKQTHPVAKELTPRMPKAPKKVALESNQRMLGWYTTDYYDTYGYGMNTNGKLVLTTYLESDMLQKYAGSKLVKIRFALTQKATVSRVLLYPVTADGIGDAVVSQAVSGAKIGWNEVTLDVPYELSVEDGTEYFLGYEYTQVSGAYPWAVNSNVQSYIYSYGNLGQGLGWYSLGNNFSLAVQGVVEFDNLPTHHVILSGFDVEGMYAKAGAEMRYMVDLENFGAEIPEDYTLELSLDGEPLATEQSPMPLENEVKNYISALTLPAELETGSHVLSVRLGSVAGQTPEDDYAQETEIMVYQECVERQKYLVEQMTSHSCTYCPLGENVLNKLNEKVDMAWVAIHGNVQSTDPYFMDTNNYAFSMLGVSGFPSAAFNRINIDGELAPTISYYEESADMAADYFKAVLETYSAPAFVKIELQAVLAPTPNKLSVSVFGHVLDDFKKLYGEDAVLTVYLTEDGLVNRQLNQGRWIQKYTHNHVLRQYLTAYNGDPLHWVEDNVFENYYELTPGKDWNTENMHAIAFVTRKIDPANIDPSKMDVNNAEIVHVDCVIEGIDGIEENLDVAERCYTIDGREATGAEKGIVILKKGDKVRKVVITQ